MLNVVGGLFVALGLVSLFVLALRYLTGSNRFMGARFGAKQQGVIIEPPIVIDRERSVVSVTQRGQRYVMLLGPNNDILLESSPDVASIQTVSEVEAISVDEVAISNKVFGRRRTKKHDKNNLIE